MQNLFDQFYQLRPEIEINAIDGLDGAGKGETVKEMAQIYFENGKNVLLIDYPQYQTPWGRVLKFLLDSGDHGLTISERLAVYALNRLESVDTIIREALKVKNDLTIIFDRFVTSNILTIAFYLDNGEMSDLKGAELERYLDESTERIRSLIDEVFEIDSDFLRLLLLENTIVCVPIIDPEISMQRLQNDSSREKLDTYERKNIQVIGNYLYRLASQYKRANIEIIEQEGRSAKSIAQEIIKFYGDKKGNQEEPQVVRIELKKVLEHSEEVQVAMDKLLNKYPKLKNLLTLET